VNSAVVVQQAVQVRVKEASALCIVWLIVYEPNTIKAYHNTIHLRKYTMA